MAGIDYPETLTGAETAELLAWRVAEWQAAEHTDEEAIYFAYHATRWVYDTYGKSAVYYTGSEIKGSELPPSLQPLIRKTWQAEDVLTNENRVQILPVPLHDYVEAVLPGWEDIRRLPSFKEQYDRIAHDPQILAGIALDKFVLSDRLHMRFDPAYFYRWGIDFYIRSDDIQIYPFGESGKTRPAMDFAVAYQDRPRIAARTVMDLAVVAARQAAATHNVTVPFEQVALFDHRLLGSAKVEITREDIEAIEPPSNVAMKNLLIQELINEGVWPPSAEDSGS